MNAAQRRRQRRAAQAAAARAGTGMAEGHRGGILRRARPGGGSEQNVADCDQHHRDRTWKAHDRIVSPLDASAVMTKTQPCTLGPKHKWEWVKDVTNIKVTITEKATRKHLSRRGVYKCACGAGREGAARSGL